MTLFQLVTLPVEFDASNRAKAQLVELGIDLALDALAEDAEQEAELGGEIEGARRDEQLAVEPGARELDHVAVLALDDGAFDAELLFHGLGPLPGHLAGLGEAEGVIAVDVKAGHGGLVSRVFWVGQRAGPATVVPDAAARPARRSASGSAANRFTSA